MSLTKDVRPGQIEKSLKAFDLAEADIEEDSIRPNLVAALKQLGFKGPYKLGQLPKWMAELEGGHFDDNSSIMIKGDDPTFDEFVAKGYGYGYAYGAEGGYQIELSAKQVINSAKSLSEKIMPASNFAGICRQR